MKRYILLPLLCLAANDAAAQRMRDFSLTPEETLREPDIQHSPQGIGSPFQNNITIGNTLPDLDMENPDAARGTILFMDRYCDPGFQPGMANPAIRPCLESAKQKACGTFPRLPSEVQRVLDHTISCGYAESDSTNDWAPDPNCSTDAAHQLDLIRKYWGEPDTAYAIAFLPQMVLDAPAFCNRGGGE